MQASDFAKEYGAGVLLLGVVLLVIVPPVGLLVGMIGGAILLFGKATASVETQVMREASKGGGCGLLLGLIAIGLMFFLLLGIGAIGAIGGM